MSKTIFKKRKGDGYSCESCVSEGIPTTKSDEQYLCIFCYSTGKCAPDKTVTEMKMTSLMNVLMDQLKR